MLKNGNKHRGLAVRSRRSGKVLMSISTEKHRFDTFPSN